MATEDKDQEEIKGTPWPPQTGGGSAPLEGPPPSPRPASRADLIRAYQELPQELPPSQTFIIGATIPALVAWLRKYFDGLSFEALATGHLATFGQRLQGVDRGVLVDPGDTLRLDPPRLILDSETSRGDTQPFAEMLVTLLEDTPEPEIEIEATCYRRPDQLKQMIGHIRRAFPRPLPTIRPQRARAAASDKKQSKRGSYGNTYERVRAVHKMLKAGATRKDAFNSVRPKMDKRTYEDNCLAATDEPPIPAYGREEY